MNTWDKVTNDRILKLHPLVQGPAAAFINECDSKLGIKLRMTQGLRTIAEQDGLYAQGRTKPGKIVTNAKGGSSYHNYGLAIDVVEIKQGLANWNCDWDSIAEVGKAHGFDWGGDFKSLVDKPHFQMSFGATIAQLKTTPKDKNGLPIISRLVV